MSAPHLSADLLAEYALDVLSRADAAAVHAHLAVCTSCSREVATVCEALATIPAGMTPAAPSERLRAAVIAATDPAHRYDGFARRVAELFDVDEPKALAFLHSATDAHTAWDGMPGMEAAVSLLHFDGGPRTAGADVGIVRFTPGLQFPAHDHKGKELQLFLQGRVVDSTGREWLPGDLSIADTDVRHSFVVDASEPCVIALVLFEGIEILAPG